MPQLNIQENISLLSLNTFGMDVRARYFIEITSEAALFSLIKTRQWQMASPLILGGGSNILFTQDYPGLVVKMGIPGIKVSRETAAHVYLTAGAGENWHQWVMYCVQQGYGGIENLSFIPGTAGAAPIQNIGAYGVELKDVLFELTAMHRKTGDCVTFDRQDCQLGYRDSVFKRELQGQYVITTVTLRLNKQPEFHLSYGAVRETLAAMGVTTPTLATVSAAITHIRQTKLPDPQKLGNAGSFFKNPIVPRAHFLQLKAQYPTMPHYSYNDSHEKLAAAWLIEQCGLKGQRIEQVGVHEQQALVLVNYGSGSGGQVQALAAKVQQAVQDKFTVRLEPEVWII